MSSTVLLHLSDTHRTADEVVSNDQILIHLENDFGRYASEGIPRPHVVVVSGDLTQSAEPKEYIEAKKLVESILRYFNLGKERLVLVPGNHDVHWPTYTKQLRLCESKDAPHGTAREVVVGGCTSPHS